MAPKQKRRVKEVKEGDAVCVGNHVADTGVDVKNAGVFLWTPIGPTKKKQVLMEDLRGNSG